MKKILFAVVALMIAGVTGSALSTTSAAEYIRNPIIGIQLGCGEEKERPLAFFGLSLLFWTLQIKVFLD